MPSNLFLHSMTGEVSEVSCAAGEVPCTAGEVSCAAGEVPCAAGVLSRGAGVLMHISMLPGRFGCGTFGRAGYAFCDWLAAMGFTAWQVLPLQPPAAGDSPYTAYSAFARNPAFLDPQLLCEAGWITPAQCDGLALDDEGYVADFAFAAKRQALLRDMIQLPALPDGWMDNPPERDPAVPQDPFAKWVAAQWDWLAPYCRFMALRARFGNAHWWHWPPAYRDFQPQGAVSYHPWRPMARPARVHNHTPLRRPRRYCVIAIMPRWFDSEQTADHMTAQDAGYHAWLQWQLALQWEALHGYAAKKGVRLIGDMPIYVAPDSADVWANRQFFCMAQPQAWRQRQQVRNWFTEVAGVPPDYFAEDGQLWGNPLYDWAALARDGYRWWIRRVGCALTDFDAVRIDHFRGFANYWAVPATASTAKSGQWKPGPGMALFRAIEAVYPQPAIIAEDLGDIDQPVRDLLIASGYPGMRVMQFAFQPEEDSIHLPHHHPAHTVAYTGTHDNNTLLGWLWEATPEQRAFVLEYCGFTGDWQQGGREAPAIRAIVRCLWQSAAMLTILPVQDVLGYGADTRMNVPGEPQGNWRIRITDAALAQADAAYWLRQNLLFRRRG